MNKLYGNLAAIVLGSSLFLSGCGDKTKETKTEYEKKTVTVKETEKGTETKETVETVVETIDTNKKEKTLDTYLAPEQLSDVKPGRAVISYRPNSLPVKINNRNYFVFSNPQRGEDELDWIASESDKTGYVVKGNQTKIDPRCLEIPTALKIEKEYVREIELDKKASDDPPRVELHTIVIRGREYITIDSKEGDIFIENNNRLEKRFSPDKSISLRLGQGEKAYRFIEYKGNEIERRYQEKVDNKKIEIEKVIPAQEQQSVINAKKLSK